MRGKSKGKISLEFAVVVGLMLVAYVVMSRMGIFLQTPVAKQLITSFGVLTPLAYAVAFITTLVIAPLPGLPIMVMGIGIFGFVNAIIFTYFLSLFGASINFYIARRFGRPVVRWLVGKRGLHKIDKHTSEFSVQLLVLSRIFDGLLFEWISYAAGLTTISFAKYFLITAVCSLPYFLLTILLSYYFTDLGQLFLAICVVNSVVMSFPLLYFLAKGVFSKARKEKLVPTS